MRAIFLFCLLSTGCAIKPLQPIQPGSGPGGGDYSHSEAIMTDSAGIAGGYWLIEPVAPGPDTASVVIFLHGFGCYNPMIYGKWLRHLARKGAVVIAPRYQTKLFEPHSSDFMEIAAGGIRRALADIAARGDITLRLDKPVYVGHSYGGTIAANMAMSYRELGIPKPAALMLCQPGVNIFRGGRIRDYRQIPTDLKTVVVLSHFDPFTSGKVGRKIASRANGALLILQPDRRGRPSLNAGHRACHATHFAFDNGVRSFSARYALRKAPTDASDFFCFWKLLDALISCSISGKECETALGPSETHTFMGKWSNGRPVRPLKKK